MTNDLELVEQLSSDWRQAQISDADHAMLQYAEKLTSTPWDVIENDVQSLRKVGFSDVAILDINQIAGYYAFVNRLADGLGVMLEKYWDDFADGQ